MPRRRRRVWVGFALCAALAILGLFVLRGAASGVELVVTMLVFIGVCVYALRGEDPDVRANSDRVGWAGWFGGWF
jgi:hypothetical protein